MVANFFLAILIVLMIIRDAKLALRYRRPYRIVFVVFWVQLLAAHWTNRAIFYPGVAISLIEALLLKIRDYSRLKENFKVAGKFEAHRKAPTLWDREIDGF